MVNTRWMIRVTTNSQVRNLVREQRIGLSWPKDSLSTHYVQARQLIHIYHSLLRANKASKQPSTKAYLSPLSCLYGLRSVSYFSNLAAFFRLGSQIQWKKVRRISFLGGHRLIRLFAWKVARQFSFVKARGRSTLFIFIFLGYALSRASKRGQFLSVLFDSDTRILAHPWKVCLGF